MTTRLPVESLLRRLLAVGLAIAATTLVAPRALGQDEPVRQAGPAVDIAADGGDVNVAGAAVVVSGNAATVRAIGASVDVRAETTGDVWVAGAQVNVSGMIGGALKAAGPVVNVNGRVGAGADVGGAVVRVGLTTGGDLRVAGANVKVGATTDVGGALQAAAGVLSVLGHVAGDVQLGGARVTFNGRADGSVAITADTVIIGERATVGGDLTIRSINPPEIAETATIAGEVLQQGRPDWWTWDVDPWVIKGAFAAAVAAGTILAGIVLMIFSYETFEIAVGRARFHPISSILIGVIVVIVMPVLAAILFATVVGLTVGIALLMLMPVLFVFGHAVAATGIAAGIFVRSPGWIGSARAFLLLIAGAIVIAIIGLAPWVGPILVFIALLLGLGALTRTL